MQDRQRKQDSTLLPPGTARRILGLPIPEGLEEFVLVVSLMGLFSSSFIPVYGAMATLSNRQYGRAIGGFWITSLLGYATATLIGGILYPYETVNSLFVLGAIYGYAGTLVLSFPLPSKVGHGTLTILSICVTITSHVSQGLRES